MTRSICQAILLLFTVTMFWGCAGRDQSQLPPLDDSRQTSQHYQLEEPDKKPGLFSKKNMVMLAGAAALYYMYRKHQNKPQATGPEGKYYLSKNGRVYYRDANHRAHWVTPPPGGIHVPAEEAAQYQEFQGFNGQTHGRDLVGLGRE